MQLRQDKIQEQHVYRLITEKAIFKAFKLWVEENEMTVAYALSRFMKDAVDGGNNASQSVCERNE